MFKCAWQAGGSNAMDGSAELHTRSDCFWPESCHTTRACLDGRLRPWSQLNKFFETDQALDMLRHNSMPNKPRAGWTASGFHGTWEMDL